MCLTGFSISLYSPKMNHRLRSDNVAKKISVSFLMFKIQTENKNKQTNILALIYVQHSIVRNAYCINWKPLCSSHTFHLLILNMWTLKCVGYYTKLKKEIRSHNHKQQEGWYFQEALQSESGKCKKQTYSTFHLIFIYLLNIWLIPRNPTALSWMSNNTYWTGNLSAKKKKKKIIQTEMYILNDCYPVLTEIRTHHRIQLYSFYYIILLFGVIKIV